MKKVFLNIKINEELKNKSKSIAAGKGQDLKDYTAEALQEKNEKERKPNPYVKKLKGE